MYVKPIIYKIYSIFIIVSGILSFLSLIGSLITLAFFDFSALTYFTNLDVELNIIKFIILGTLGFCALLSLLFSYSEFSSMFAFANMIEHEKKELNQPMKRGMLILPGKFYSKFGTIIFGIVATITVVSSILLVITESVTHNSFIAIPVIPIVLILIPCVLYYINYYLRYNSIGNLLDVVTSTDIKETQKQRIKEINTSWLRGYCVFLFIICVLIAIAVILSMFFAFEPLNLLLGTPITIAIFVGEIIITAISIIFTGLYGCYMDNIAKMVEHHQIKFGLFDKQD